jgi:TPR repeat protein
MIVTAVVLVGESVAGSGGKGLSDDWLATPLMEAMDKVAAKPARAISLLKAGNSEQAVEVLKDAVTSDRDRDAQYLLGWCHASGTGTARSLKQARDMFHGAALREHRASQYSLGRLLLDTAQAGNKRMVDSGITYIGQAAEAGMPAAMGALGQIYRYGVHGSIEVDTRQAVAWLKQAANAGDAEALYHQGVMLENGEAGKVDLRQAGDLLNSAANNGSTAAMVYLGKHEAAKVPPNKSGAKTWFEKAANLNSADARHQLGLLLQNTDPSQAFDYFRHAAAQDHSEAQSDLGFCYEHGYGTDKNASEAFSWYQKSAKRGDRFGMYNLAGCYEKGLGVGSDDAKASKWFRSSGIAGLAEAQHMVGLRYLSGVAGEKDLVAAAAWFELAAKQEYPPAMCDLGEIHETSKGMLYDSTKALNLYLGAIAKEHAEARFRLGTMHKEGNGVPVNLEVAYILYLGAVEQGYTEGKRDLQSLGRLLTPDRQKAADARYKASPSAVPAG